MQGKSIDVILAKRAADLTIQTLRTCRTDEAFEQVWALTDSMSERFKELIKDWPRFSFRDATAPRSRQVSRRLLSLAGEAAEEPSVPRTAADYHRINTYFRSLDQVVAELESRFTGNDQDVLCALGDIVAGNQPTQRSFQLVADHYELDEDLLTVEQDMFRNFRDSNDDIRLESAVDVLGCMHENGLNDFLPHFAKAVKVLSIIPATSCTSERSFSALRRLKTYLRSTMEQSRLNSLAVICIERVYANLVLKNDIDKIINVLASRKGRASAFF